MLQHHVLQFCNKAHVVSLLETVVETEYGKMGTRSYVFWYIFVNTMEYCIAASRQIHHVAASRLITGIAPFWCNIYGVSSAL